MTTKKEETKTLAQALIAARAEFESVVKKSANPFHKSKYADLNQHLDAVIPALEKQGIILSQPTSVRGEGEHRYQVVSTQLRLGDEVMVSELELPHIPDPQKIGAAITYYRRYTLSALLSLSAEDDDANSVSKSAQDKNNNIMETNNPHKLLGQPEPVAKEELETYIVIHSPNATEIQGKMLCEISPDFFEQLAKDKKLQGLIDTRDLVNLRHYYTQFIRITHKTKGQQ